MMPYYVGIDGGGTKTAVELRTRGSAAHSRAVFGPLNCNSDRTAAAKTLTDTLAWLAAQPEGLAGCDGLCIGSAGISNPDAYNFIQDIIRAGGYTGPLQIVGDQVTALAGALGQPVGTVLIAGTGSICYARTADGREARSGGWGHLIGDEGSGYALGRDALAAVARAWDGWGEKTLLSQLLAEQMELDDQKKIISYTYGGDKSRIAALAPLVEQAAKQDDGVALEIIRDNAVKMTGLVGAVARQLGIKAGKVAMLGGLLEHDTKLRETFVAEMGRQYPALVCTEPERDAAAGALMLAKEML